MSTTIDISSLNDSLLNAAVKGREVRFLNDDFAIVFRPSSTYYNRGPNRISSDLAIVFRHLRNFTGRELATACIGQGIRPTQKAIDAAVELAQTLLKTVRPAEQYVAEVGPGVTLKNGQYGFLYDEAGTPVVPNGDAIRTECLKNRGNGHYVTSTPQSEAQVAEQKRLETEAKRDAAAAEWMSAYEAADQATKLEMVRNIVRI